MYRGMLRIRLLDERLLALQRQGRIGFYGEATRPGGGVVGGAAALEPEDWIVPGAARGRRRASTAAAAAHATWRRSSATPTTSTQGPPDALPPGLARQPTTSSCPRACPRQLPHATGIAMAAKHRAATEVVALGYMGDGGTSEEDFHVALNFAGVFKAPVVFVCQNNQWAISTPLAAADGVARPSPSRGSPTASPALRVDGNDVLRRATRPSSEAVDRRPRRRRADVHRGADLPGGRAHLVGRSHPLPRRGRDRRAWRQEGSAGRASRRGCRPRHRSRRRDEAALTAELEAEIRDAIAAEEAAAPPALRTLIEDVFAEPTPVLREQLAELERVRAQPTRAPTDRPRSQAPTGSLSYKPHRGCETLRTDAVVIGAGPGGYVAGIRLGQLGKKAMSSRRTSRAASASTSAASPRRR